MKFKHRPLEIDAVQFEPGMEEGLLAFVKKNKAVAEPVFFPYFKNENVQDKIRSHRFAAHIEKTLPAILVANRPVPLNEGDWVATHPDGSKVVFDQETLDSLYEIAEVSSGKQDEEAEATRREHKEKDNAEQASRPVRRGRPPKAAVAE